MRDKRFPRNVRGAQASRPEAPGPRRRRGAAVLVGAMLALTAPALAVVAPGGQGKGKGRPGVEFDEEKSPLQKEIEQRVDARKMKEVEKPACRNAVESGNQADIDKFCMFPRLSARKLDQSECPTCGDLVNPAGKVIGKRIKTRTTLDFVHPSQRVEGMTRWENVAVQKRAVGEIGGLAALGAGPEGRGRLRRAALFPDSAVNDDRDCLDVVTGERRGGYRSPSLPPTPDSLVPDGDPASCFDAAGQLKRTLARAPGGCLHESGRLLLGDPADDVEDDCFEEGGALKTSLEELLDEDGPESIDDDGDGLQAEDPAGDADGDGNPNDDHDCMNPQGVVLRGADCLDPDGALREGLAELVDEDGEDALDQDGDGRVNEDPQVQDLDAACRDFGAARGMRAGLGDAGVGDTCDLTRAVIVAVNDEAVRRHGRKIYNADDEGRPDPAAGGVVDFGSERRRVVLTETFTLACEDGLLLVDGQCASEAAAPPGGIALRGGDGDRLAGDAAAPDASLPAAAGPDGTVASQVMMGFTFAPPVLKWGPTIEEYACVDLPLLGEVCVEVFFARIGYEFDVALGLRLPMEVQVSQVPAPSAPAGEPFTLRTTLQPLDFTARQYREFCEAHHLDREPFISGCERFSFPSFLDLLNPFVPESQVDGDEFVARAVVFAGVIVRVAMVPVIQWGIDSANDLPTLCTFLQLKDNNFNLLNFGIDVAQDGSVLNALKNQLANCASFATPFGLETDPTNPLLKRLRAFPWGKSFDVRADCAEALVRGETVTIKKKTRPICTNLFLGANGASLGIGLGMEVSAGSNLAETVWSVAEDGRAASGAPSEAIQFRHSADEGKPPVDLGPILADNYDPGVLKDTARLTLEDFTYFLNTVQIKLRARLQFGGILSPIPDLASLTLYNFVFGLEDTGIPIGQHAGTENVEIPVFVENHALQVDARPASSDPAVRVDEDTLRVKPGEFGDFEVAVRNLGSVFGDFDNFRYEISNRPDQSPPYSFGINPNTDFDCADASGTRFRGDPYDGVADDCFGAGGQVRSDRVELIDEDPAGPAGAPADVRDQDGDGLVDEDPADSWQGTPAPPVFAQGLIEMVPPYTLSTDVPDPTRGTVRFSISPFRHPLTSPGRYPIRVLADSRPARERAMDPVDASGLARRGASDVVFMEVASFHDAQVEVTPASPVGPPGLEQVYTVAGTNGGNGADSMTVSTRFVDFNQAACTLANLGRLPAGSDPGCPYRAFPTVIQADAGGIDWTTVSNLPDRFGPLEPLETASGMFTVLVPASWAGMQDAVY